MRRASLSRRRRERSLLPTVAAQHGGPVRGHVRADGRRAPADASRAEPDVRAARRRLLARWGHDALRAVANRNAAAALGEMSLRAARLAAGVICQLAQLWSASLLATWARESRRARGALHRQSVQLFPALGLRRPCNNCFVRRAWCVWCVFVAIAVRAFERGDCRLGVDACGNAVGRTVASMIINWM